MKLTDNKVRLSDLAHELKVTPSAIRQHLSNKSGLGQGAEKFGARQTGDYLLNIQSVLNFLNFLKLKGRKVKMEDILRVEEGLKQ